MTHSTRLPKPEPEINILLIMKPAGTYAFLYHDEQVEAVREIAASFVSDPELDFNHADVRIVRERTKQQ